MALHSSRVLHSLVRHESAASEALPEDDLRPVLLVLLLADPRRAEGGQVGQRRPAAPHREDPALGAADADALPHVGGQQTFDFGLETLGKPRQQSVPAFRETVLNPTLKKKKLNHVLKNKRFFCLNEKQSAHLTESVGLKSHGNTDNSVHFNMKDFTHIFQALWNLFYFFPPNCFIYLVFSKFFPHRTQT